MGWTSVAVFFLLGLTLGYCASFAYHPIITTLEGEYAKLQTDYAKMQSDYDNLQRFVFTGQQSHNTGLPAIQSDVSLVVLGKYNAHAGGYCVLSQDVGADFRLENIGKDSGNALVRLTGGGSTLAENEYLVRARTIIDRSLKVTIDCNQEFEVNIWIVSVKTA